MHNVVRNIKEKYNILDLFELVKTYNEKHDYSNEPKSMYKTFVKCLSKHIVQEETISEHRWYDIRSVVHAVDIDGGERYFETFDYHITGDNCASDMDLDMPTLDDVVEVYPHVVTKTVYK